MIVSQQDADLFLGKLWHSQEMGKVTVTVVPFPKVETQLTFPLRKEARSRMLSKPHPLSSFLRIFFGSKPFPSSQIFTTICAELQFKLSLTFLARACFSTLFNAS